MFPTRWFRRLSVVCGGVMLAGGIVLAVWLAAQLQDRDEEIARIRLESAADHATDAIASAADGTSAGELADVVRRIADRRGVSGEWLPAAAPSTEGEPSGIASARRDGSSFWTAIDPQRGTAFAHYGRAVQVKGKNIGVVHVSQSLEDAEARRGAVLQRFAWGFAAIVLATALLAWLMVRGVSRTTAQLEAAFRDVEGGNLNAEVAEDRRDEFGRLSQRFNEMTAAVNGRFRQQKDRERELEEHEEFLQAVLATMVEAVIAVDGSQRILFANRASRKLLGMNHNELVGRPIWEVARSPVLQATLQRVLTENAEQQIEFPLPRTKSVVIMAASRLPGTPPPGAVLVLHDVTELRRLENLRRDFVSNVSHELKTPLTSIQAYADTLMEGGLDDPAHNREFVERISEGAERLHTLIQDILSLARIEADEQISELRPVSLREVADLCVREHAAVAEAKSLRFIVEQPEGDVHVLADVDGVRTILDNLLDNAIKYTPEKGTVTLRYRDAGDTVQIDVADTGIGIPREHRERIFERFYRVDRARSREMGGTGLGLAIVKHLTMAFDGSVFVESEPGRGTTFTVNLPRATSEGPMHAEPSSARVSPK